MTVYRRRSWQARRLKSSKGCDLLKRDKLINVLVVFVALVLVLFLGVNIYRSTGNSYKKSIAVVTTVADTVDAELFIIRNEEIVQGDKSGVVVPLAVNGERIGKNSKIAAVFSNEQAAENYASAEVLNKKLENYRKIDNQVKLANLDMKKLSDEINSDFYRILDTAYNNDFSALSEDEMAFSEKLSRKNISLGYEVDCSAQIAALESEIASLKVSDPSDVVLAEYAGYFVSRPDGYEGVLTVDSIDTLTEEQLSDAFKAEKQDVPENAMGKIITDYDWYAAAIVDDAEIAETEPGRSVRLMLGDSEKETVNAKLYSKKMLEGNKMLLVFKSSEMNDQIATIRKTRGKIVMGDYTGIKIRREAVRFNEKGEPGVFILEGNVAKFNKIEEIYSNESVVVAKDKTGSPGWLARYDVIIVSGRGLENGKII